MAELEKLQSEYKTLLEKSLSGDKDAFKKKAEVMRDIRKAERELHAPEKRSLQQEYVRKFDDQAVVEISPKAGESAKPTTLREHHAKRLGVKK